MIPANVPPRTLVTRVCASCSAHLGDAVWEGASTLLPDPPFGVYPVAPGVTRCVSHGLCEPCLAEHEARVRNFERARRASRGEAWSGSYRDCLGDGEDEAAIGGRW